jgi:hypothetical protein
VHARLSDVFIEGARGNLDNDDSVHSAFSSKTFKVCVKGYGVSELTLAILIGTAEFLIQV